MKQPMPPPDTDELMEELSSKGSAALMRVFASGDVSVATDPYLPWDKLRYRPAPDGLSSEEWWLATKLARRAVSRTLPFKAIDGKFFSYTLPDELLKLVESISQRASGQIGMSEQITNHATRDRYIVSSLIEEAITSSQLEGASTSRVVAKEMIRSGRPPRDKSEQMIFNNYRAMRMVGEIRGDRLTPELVCEIHRIVTEGTLDDPSMAGRLQDRQADRVAVFSDHKTVVHVPPPVDELPARLRLLCEFANAGDAEAGPWLSPLLRAITIHFMTGYDHYFEDGNGRTARALFYWSMLKSGYWLTEFLSISRILKRAPAQYMNSYIYTEQDDGDLTYFLLYQANVVRRSIQDLSDYLAAKMREVSETRALLSATPGDFNYRQLAILEAALKDASAVFTVKSHAASHLVSGESARHDLLDLEKRGFLSRGKVSREYFWRPVLGLADRIKSKS